MTDTRMRPWGWGWGQGLSSQAPGAQEPQRLSLAPSIRDLRPEGRTCWRTDGRRVSYCVINTKEEGV